VRIQGIIFDLDGTLVHTIEDIAGAANMLFEKRGLPIHDVSYYTRCIGNGAVKFIERAYGKAIEQERLMELVTDFREIYGKNLHNRSRIYDGVPGMLDTLSAQGVRLAILSNKPHGLTTKVVDHYLSGWPFEHVFGQREGIPRKPDPAGAMEIAGAWGMMPGKILFVGDSDNDILTARAAGMNPLGVAWGYGRLETGGVENGCPLVRQPGEILEYLNRAEPDNP
jgi:phosphoglycolate phosphatase